MKKTLLEEVKEFDNSTNKQGNDEALKKLRIENHNSSKEQEDAFYKEEEQFQYREMNRKKL